MVLFTSYIPSGNETSVTGLAALSGVNYDTQAAIALCPAEYLNETALFQIPDVFVANSDSSGKISKNGTKIGYPMCWPYWNSTSDQEVSSDLDSADQGRFTNYDPTADIQLHHCVYEQVPPKCAIYYAPFITLIVAVVTGVQALLMSVVIVTQREEPLVLLGDVIASYLQKPDLYTSPQQTAREMSISSPDLLRLSRVVIFLVLLVELIVCMSWGATKIGKPGLYPSDHNSLRWLIAPISITGATQIILVLQVYFENIQGTMVRTIKDFNRFAVRPSVLRVSSPRLSSGNMQKGAYILQMPLGVAICHVFTSAFIHWWASLYIHLQLFVVIRLGNLPDYFELNVAPNNTLLLIFIKVLYSGVNLVAVILEKISEGSSAASQASGSAGGYLLLVPIVGIPLLIFVGAMVLIFSLPFMLNMAFVSGIVTRGSDESWGDPRTKLWNGQGTNSLHVSAACHPPSHEGDISEKRIKWVRVNLSDEETESFYTFTSRYKQHDEPQTDAVEADV